jgi:hypothetical protein
MPELCPRCHAVGTLILIEDDIDEMSEGEAAEAADYLAGIWGTAYCDACKFEFDWVFERILLDRQNRLTIFRLAPRPPMRPIV